MDAITRVVEKDNSRLVEVRLQSMLDQDTERWFAEYLHKANGVAYIEMNQETGHIVGYGVWEHWWDQFRFWLGASIYAGLDACEEDIRSWEVQRDDTADNQITPAR